ncbi:MAG: cell division FtsK/SpoIIIE [candidate division WS6 bacterium GW2011_GWF2_39_15]|uniref:Cell division FtsK/SpoIIIE n=1 Tax=candidate division WS6 bacterium GW2011_GWF2_39_15 TaxID=1619100 RepID=A0A0G0Q545_9BACT|nr:MAG: cell division FtsK/SpoIIIE [candidate division WS6 bacterium GW2011_GWF2_39_15]
MGRRKGSKKKKDININSDETKVFVGIILTILSIALIISPFFDSHLFRSIVTTFGYSSVVFGFTTLYLALRFFSSKTIFKSWKLQLGLLFFSLTFAAFLTFWVPNEQLQSPTQFEFPAGMLGYNIHLFLLSYLGRFIEFLVLIVSFVVSISLITSIKLSQIRDYIEKTVENTGGLEFKGSLEDIKPQDLEQDDKRMDGIINGLDSKREEEQDIIFANDAPKSTENHIHIAPKKVVDENDMGLESQGPKYTNWTFPSLDLLQDPIVQPQNKDVFKKNALIIEQTLRSFGVLAKVAEISVGPTVVQYALSISVGIKVSKVRNLTNDLALALAAPSSSVRIEAPIPGTSLIGIEAPNPTPNYVYEKEMVAQLLKDKSKYELPLILGKDVTGKLIIRDLVDLPHVLVAGATGTGKSVGINSMLMGLLMSKSPDELRFILVDPKMVEMAPYNGIPHLLTPVITDMELVVNALQWAIEEMLKRYRMLKQAGVKKITEYNQQMGFSAMPYIIIVIDEMADLMLSTGVDVETKVVRLAQMARAVGIHLILATQRPSVNVITGLIKANMPGRVAFNVTTAIDSRVVIDQIGAETLLGKGDMLFKSPSHPRPIRIQGAFTDNKDLDNVIKFIKDQTEIVEYTDEVTKAQVVEAKGGTSAGADDPVFRQSIDVIINAQKASASLLQRKLRIGYNRAARLMDELEEAGAIGPQDGSNPRKVLISSASQILGSDSNDELPQ